MIIHGFWSNFIRDLVYEFWAPKWWWKVREISKISGKSGLVTGFGLAGRCGIFRKGTHHELVGMFGGEHWLVLVPLLFCLFSLKFLYINIVRSLNDLIFHKNRMMYMTYFLSIATCWVSRISFLVPCHSGVQGSSSAQGWDESAGPGIPKLGEKNLGKL